MNMNQIPAPLVATKILGQDDWLFFGRTADGVLVYTTVEVDWHWTETPHKGDCWSETTGRNCDGETKFTCRKDCAWMLEYVTANAADYSWDECGYDTDGSYLGWPVEKDTEFIASSAANYLPLPQKK